MQKKLENNQNLQRWFTGTLLFLYMETSEANVDYKHRRPDPARKIVKIWQSMHHFPSPSPRILLFVPFDPPFLFLSYV